MWQVYNMWINGGYYIKIIYTYYTQYIHIFTIDTTYLQVINYSQNSNNLHTIIMEVYQLFTHYEHWTHNSHWPAVYNLLTSGK